MGFRGFRQPLSAQAQTPVRPSGDAKEQEPAENEGSAGPGLAAPRLIARMSRQIGIASLNMTGAFASIGLQRSRNTVNSALSPM